MENKNDSTSLIALEAMLNNNSTVLKEEIVMIIENVAMIYEVDPEYLQEQVNKNIKRFPEGFSIRLTNKEQNILKTVYRCVLTEKGILMAGGILKSKKAIKVHIQMIKHFVKLYKKNFNNITIDNNEAESVFNVLKQLIK